MLDIRFIRENPEKVAENCKNRNNKWDINALCTKRIDNVFF